MNWDPEHGKPEIMAPAGHWPQLRAAIEAGADAVYFGLTHFTARAKVGFSLEELPEALRTLHARGVKGYVTFNSLVFDHELETAARALGAIAEAGADAVIVQDLGALRLLRRMAPEVPVHASTQMSITSAAGVRLARELGASRVTLARELSLDQVRAIRRATDGELEIFVHGALCVAYSGQCFSSEAWGGRSANRGQCAQACRLPYELLAGGRPAPMGDARYPLSPGDLLTLSEIPEIVRSGVAALKIEGRYKDADYVALVTRAYRKAVDEAWAGLSVSASEAERLELEQLYSRGSGPYFLAGTNHQAVVRGRAPRHRGVLMGRVARVERGAVVIETAPAGRVAPLKAGDGVVFDAADWRSPEEPEEGGRVYEAAPGGDGLVALRFANRALKLERIRAGDLLWRTHDPELDKAARPFAEAARPVRRQPVAVRARASEGAPLASEWRLMEQGGIAIEISSPVPLGRARRQALSESLLREQFSRLGGTPYELGELRLEIEGQPFAPASLLNAMRRQAVERLQALQSAPPRRAVDRPGDVWREWSGEAGAGAELDTAPRLHLLVRVPEQLESALELRPASITLDYLDLWGLRPSLDRVRRAGIAARVAAPRVLKPGEERIEDFLRSLGCAVLVRSAGLLWALRGRGQAPLDGDFSLNAANAITARTLFEMGLNRLAPAHDLNGEQVAELARAAGAHRIEAVAYHHMPVFHTEHCVFCRFLSQGTSYRDCGRPCETQRVELRDPLGRAHPVLADVGCRNTVFGAEAQEASAHLEAWIKAGIRHFRLEFAHESGAQVTAVAQAFTRYFEGGRSGARLAAELRRAAPAGITEGSLFVPPGYRELTVLK